VLGVTIATAAMVCILSVFNGFENMVADLFTAFDPELKVLPAQGKYVDTNEPLLQKIKTYEGLDKYVEVVEDKALVVTSNRQHMVTVKGVDDSFFDMVDFRGITMGDGQLVLHSDSTEYGIFGVSILSSLGLQIDFPDTLSIYAPKKGKQINIANPPADFRSGELCSPHLAFMALQAKYDNEYVLTSINFARRLFDKAGKVTGVELSLKDGTDIKDAKKWIRGEVGDKYRVLDRYEQQADIFKIMEVEKLVSYLFLTFILLIACFNIVSSISMLIIDKRKDIKTLHNLGANNRDISRIFLLEGWLVSIIGAIVGILIGVGLCLLQQHFGFLKFGSSAGSYIIDVYPVSMKLSDIIIVFFTVVLIGYLAVWYPVKYLSKKQT
jgi:lipoprotein-releasing system permease protein